MARDPDKIVGLDPRFKIGDIVFNCNGLAYEVQLDPARPMMSGHPGRSTNGAKFVFLEDTRIICRYTLATQKTMMTAAESIARRKALEPAFVAEDELVPIF